MSVTAWLARRLLVVVTFAAAYGWQDRLRGLPGPRVRLVLPLLEPGHHAAVPLAGLVLVWHVASLVAARAAPARVLPPAAVAAIRGCVTFAALVAVQAASLELVRQAVLGFAWQAALGTASPYIAGTCAAAAVLVSGRRHASPTHLAGRLRRAALLAAPLLLLTAAGMAVAAASAPDPGAEMLLPAGWVQIERGAGGGTVWRGAIANTAVPDAHRDALVYLPPGIDPQRRYPVVYLLHGLRGSPESFLGGLQFATVADALIAGGRVPPFVAVIPAAGRSIDFDGEWTGPWERYVVGDVVPWARAHLPVVASADGSSIAGYSAGGYGALDIGLRHPALFRTLESWSGYYTAPHDGSLTDASASVLAAHDPTGIAEDEAPLLRHGGTRVFISLGRQERFAARPAARFAGVLAGLGIPHRLMVVRGHHNARTWRTQLPAALEYGLGSGPRPAAAADPLLPAAAAR